MLNCTGWKIGWSIGPEELIRLGAICASAAYYCFNMPGQVAIANALDKVNDPYEGALTFPESIKKLFCENRDYLLKEVAEMDLPWQPLKVEGGYFLMVDITQCESLIPQKYKDSHVYENPEKGAHVTTYNMTMPDGRVPIDLAFCRWMACEKGVVMMPNCFFYEKGNPELCEKYVRLAIYKDSQSTR